MATPKQIQIIHILKNNLHLNEAQYGYFLAGFKVSSSKELSPRDAEKAIRLLKSYFKNSWKNRYRGGQPGKLTQAQADAIARHEDRLGWTANSQRMQGMIARVLKKKVTIASLTKPEATRVLIALQKTRKGKARNANSRPKNNQSHTEPNSSGNKPRGNS